MEAVEHRRQPGCRIKVISLDFMLSLIAEEGIQIQVRRQKVCGQGRTPGRRDCTVQEVAALLFMSPIAPENILYHVHSWLSTNSKAIFIIV